MSKQHVLILGDVDSVKDYLDFFENQYSIITSEYEYNFMPSSIQFAANAVYSVATPSYFDAACFENNMEIILKYVAELVERFGKIDSVVVTHEHTVLPAAIIRTKFDIQGLKEQQALALRDKNKMKAKISEHGLPTPGFAYLDAGRYEEQIREFLNTFKTIVLKPTDQAGSHGILITSDFQAATAHATNLFESTNNVAIEQFIDKPLMHFDGVASHGNVEFLSVSKYIGTCYDYVYKRKSFATVILADQKIYNKVKSYVEQCLQALQIENIVFHLEVFADEQGDFVFLEIAGRYVGGGVTNMIQQVFDFDIVRASYDLDCQSLTGLTYDEQICHSITPMAKLWLPSPVTSTFVLRGVSGIEQLPDNVVGSEFMGPGTRYEHSPIDAFKALARVFIADRDTANIERSIRQIEAQVKFHYEEV